jgi:hypothetical protein
MHSNAMEYICVSLSTPSIRMRANFNLVYESVIAITFTWSSRYLCTSCLVLFITQSVFTCVGQAYAIECTCL